MEPVTHLLTGAVLSRAGFNRMTALATVTMTLAAEAPDIDVLAYFKSPAYGFIQHRGITHTVFAVPVLAAIVVGLVWLVDALWQRWRTRSGARPNRPATALAAALNANPPRRWGRLYLLACIAGLSHLLLDFTNSYGVRPLYPLFRHWYAWDIVFIFEPLMFAALLAALVLPWFFALIGQEIGARNGHRGTHGPRGRAASIAALLFILALWGVRDVEHRRAVAAVEAEEFHGSPSIRAAAFPYMFNPFRWAGVAETSDAYISLRVDSLNVGSLSPEADSGNFAATYYKPQPTAATRAARNSALGRFYVEWARFPLVEDETLPAPAASHLVHFLDVRFLYPESRLRPLAAYVLLDSDLKTLEEGFESSKGRR